MTGPSNRAELVVDITNFITLLWEDIEKNEGAQASEFFEEDGVFDSKMVCFNGRKEIREWFKWRSDLARTARHLLNNFYFDFSKWEEAHEVEVRAIMTHYGASGKGVLPVSLPIGIYDTLFRLREGGSRGWSIRLLVNDPVFLADDHVAKSYKPAS